jgi:hypothetical protein
LHPSSLQYLYGDAISDSCNINLLVTAVCFSKYLSQQVAHASAIHKMDLNKKRIPVWLDCDPGHDDAAAIILAGYSPSIRLLGLSTTHGNQSTEKTTKNALNITNIAGLSYIPVVPGAVKPLVRPSLICAEIHGGRLARFANVAMNVFF